MRAASRTFAALLLFLLPAYARAETGSKEARPSYRVDAAIDYELLTFKCLAQITIPAAAADPLRDAAFFLYANAAGIVDDERRKYIVVDGVKLNGEALPFTLQGPVLHVSFDKPQERRFPLQIEYHGVVPRGTNAGGGGALFGSLSGGGLPGNLGGLTGGKSKKENSDFGLYAYSDGVLSLGSFWYPQLAVRREGKWVDEEPKGLGDVTYANMGDFDVTLSVPANLKVVTSGTEAGAAQDVPGGLRKRRYTARDVRDFAILLSEDYVSKSLAVKAAGRTISVEAYTTRKNENRLEKVLDIAAHALQFYSDRFGPYPYGSFKVVEGTIRGGAGGMEFSELTSLAPMVYIDWNEQIRAMTGLVGNGGLDKLLGGLTGGNAGESSKGQASPASPQDALGGFLNMFLGPQTNMLNSLLEMTIAHETAHQWWAIGVGSDSVREPFVDESLTNYSAVLYFEERYGRAVADQIIGMHLKTTYSMARLLGEPDAPANLPTSAYNDNVQYGGIVYGKGALYYDALRRAVGDAAFFASLREYYSKYRGALAGSHALLDIVRAKAPDSGADRIYRHWIEEAHGDEDISGASLGGLQEILAPFLQLLGNSQPGTPAKKP